jgi:hypothetical protein
MTARQLHPSGRCVITRLLPTPADVAVDVRRKRTSGIWPKHPVCPGMATTTTHSMALRLPWWSRQLLGISPTIAGVWVIPAARPFIISSLGLIPEPLQDRRVAVSTPRLSGRAIPINLVTIPSEVPGNSGLKGQSPFSSLPIAACVKSGGSVFRSSCFLCAPSQKGDGSFFGGKLRKWGNSLNVRGLADLSSSVGF